MTLYRPFFVWPGWKIWRPAFLHCGSNELLNFQKDIRKARRLRKRWELRQGDPDKMAALRAKFVAQAKKYIGVPYAKKYWAPECKYN